ncbi:MAG: DUF4406 domain-containing protein [Brachymonas sp.]|nr:DUF4406 domain-containing protein [Brachymonas sp.]
MTDWKERAERAEAELARLRAVEPVALPGSRTQSVYLAGPMTGYADFNFPAFNAAANGLRAEGLRVVNPADHGLVEGATWADYLRHDIAKIAGCESIALLPGWSKSKGAQLEVHIARALEMPIRMLEGAEAAPPAQPAEPVQRLSDERAAFEAWHNEYRTQELVRRDDTYYNTHVRCRWEGWQARAIESALQPGWRDIETPPGWKLVPICLTPEMREVLLMADRFTVGEVYIMLLAAAPKATK